MPFTHLASSSILHSYPFQITVHLTLIITRGFFMAMVLVVDEKLNYPIIISRVNYVFGHR
jgi:hypothetical protein